MDFPIELKSTSHHSGGQILRITAISHDTYSPDEGRSRDEWFFIGDVKWNRTGVVTEGLRISPISLMYDEDRSEIDALLAALNEYLAANGRWCGPKTKHQGWFAKKRTRS